jgi:hypothetical protein
VIGKKKALQLMVQSKAEEDKARATRRIEEKLKRQMNRLERILPEAIARRLGDFKAGRVTGAGDIGGFPLDRVEEQLKGYLEEVEKGADTELDRQEEEVGGQMEI